MQRLLVSVRGKIEAVEAVNGGAHIADVEFPASALGRPYPLNIRAVRRAVAPETQVSTNIGEQQLNNGTACQAAVGVAIAGADIVKAGLAKMTPRQAIYLAKSIVRSVRTLAPGRKIILAFFADTELAHDFTDPVGEAPQVAIKGGADGVLIDTFDKSLGKGILDYLSLTKLRRFVEACSEAKIEAWFAGSITLEQMPSLWKTQVDVICVRQAACEPGKRAGRFGQVTSDRVQRLVATIPR